MSGSKKPRSYSGGNGGGGGNNGSTGTGGHKGDSGDPCSSLVVDTILNSPVPKVVSGLKKGDRLKVATMKAGSLTRLVAIDDRRAVAGSLTPPELVAIIRCIEKGHSYVAVFLSDFKGGSVNVRIQSGAK